MISDNDLVVIVPGIGKITLKEAVDKGLLKPLPHGNTGRKHTAKTKLKIGEALSGKKKPPGFGEAMSKARKGEEHPWARGEKSSNKRPEVRKKIRKALLGKKKSPEHCINISEARKELWKDPKFAKMMGESQRKTPNRLEKAFNILLLFICPGEFKYVGDGYFKLGKKRPDFLNINGKKKLIETFGDFWHEDEDEEKRINYFKKYEYDCLVIWESEFWKETVEVTRKVLSFVND